MTCGSEAFVSVLGFRFGAGFRWVPTGREGRGRACLDRGRRICGLATCCAHARSSVVTTVAATLSATTHLPSALRGNVVDMTLGS
jgi:hypothetical protein